eukprot:tig00000691_g3160.t1
MKRARKYQEFNAHAGNTRCLEFGRKGSGLFATGGEDRKVNIWMANRPGAPMASLLGHKTSAECCTFDPEELNVVAGSSGGTLMLWDLETQRASKTMRGHLTNCTAVEFHPYGQYFGSGSLDTNLKIWDVRQKGAVATYKGHTKAITKIKFSPDGRWVVSGGDDGLVKVWDLTAGKLLKDFATHTGSITSVDFHPSEFLLVTGSMDRTVKFWDVETFACVSSTTEAETGIRAASFTPDGKVVVAASHEALRVWAWEPVYCYDAIDLSLKTLADWTFMHDQLVAALVSSSFVQLYLVDMRLVRPFCSAADYRPPTTHRPNTAPRGPVHAASVPSDSPEPDDLADLLRAAPLAPQASPPSSAAPGPRPSPSAPRAPAPPPHRPRPRPPAPHQLRPAADAPRPSAPPRSASGRAAASAASAAPPASNVVALPRQSSASSSSPGAPSAPPSPRPGAAERRPATPRPSHAPPSALRWATPSPRRAGAAAGPSDALRPAHHGAPPPRPPVLLRPPPLPVPARPLPSRPVGGAGPGGGAGPSVRAGLDPRARPEAHSYVPEVPAGPVGLDIAAFARDAMLVPGNDQAVMAALLEKHGDWVGIMRARASQLRLVRQQWAQGGARACAEMVARISEPPVTADVVAVLVQRPAALDLDVARLLLPALRDLLGSKYETYWSKALEMVALVTRAFSQRILDSVGSRFSVGVDLVAEERQQKCRACYDALVALKPAVQRLAEKSGRAGQAARSLLPALEPFA